MGSKIGIIIGREFSERVKKKSFIITTILMPLVMVVLMALPSIIMLFGGSDTKRVAVIDDTGVIAPGLENNDEVKFIAVTVPLESALQTDSVDAILVIPSTAVENTSGITLYNNGPSSMSLESEISGQLEDIIEHKRIEATNIDNFKELMEQVKCDVSLTTFRNDTEGEAESSSSALSFGLGLALTMILYMFLLIYGQMVMTSIIEEKGNRVLEIVVSSVKPMQLMLGKIFGIALVAVVQVLIWTVLLTAMSAFVLPMLMPETMSADLAAFNAGTLTAANAATDIEAVQVVAMLADPTYILGLFGMLLLFLVGGFLFYAAIYAAVGSAVDNIQDASQLQTVTVVPIIIGIMVSMSVANDPNSMLALVCSMIPFTSPMVMMARIPFGIPGWQIGLSVALLYASFAAMVWVAAKVYRVGIFMYGKKPTVRDLINWIKQS